jgi:hypothetical protein
MEFVNQAETQISPPLKWWLHNVLVPAMVKRWIAEHGKEHFSSSSPTAVQANHKRKGGS